MGHGILKMETLHEISSNETLFYKALKDSLCSLRIPIYFRVFYTIFIIWLHVKKPLKVATLT